MRYLARGDGQGCGSGLISSGKPKSITHSPANTVKDHDTVELKTPTPSDSQLIQQVIDYKISYYSVTSTGSQSLLHAWQLEIMTRVSHARNAV